jgi:hypothetical protein
MPKMPNDDEEHQPCRQMAAVLIERTIYDEHIAQRWFQMAVNNIKNHPKCANHPKTCACKMALEGWLQAANQIQVYHLNVFYEAHYEHEKDEAYLDAVRAVAKFRGRTFEQQMEDERRERAQAEEEDCEERRILLEDCVNICYQDLSLEDLKAYNLHGWYKVTKTAECYEFMLMETSLQNPFWRKAEAEHMVTKVPLHVKMGMRSTSFEAVTPDKIHTS